MLPVKKSSFTGSAFAGSGAMSALLAKLACPVCYPVFAGLLSSLGIGTVVNQTYMDVLAAVLVPLAVFGLAYRARQRRGFGPFFLGVMAVGAGFVGRFTGLDVVYFGGVGGLVTASVWNIFPKRSNSRCAREHGDFDQPAQRKDRSMGAKRKIEIFSAGCSACEDTIKLVKDNSCPSCDVIVLDTKEAAVKSRMQELGIKSVPAVVIDGKLANCCSSSAPNLNELKAAGLGKA